MNPPNPRHGRFVDQSTNEVLPNLDKTRLGPVWVDLPLMSNATIYLAHEAARLFQPRLCTRLRISVTPGTGCFVTRSVLDYGHKDCEPAILRIDAKESGYIKAPGSGGTRVIPCLGSSLISFYWHRFLGDESRSITFSRFVLRCLVVPDGTRLVQSGPPGNCQSWIGSDQTFQWLANSTMPWEKNVHKFLHSCNRDGQDLTPDDPDRSIWMVRGNRRRKRDGSWDEGVMFHVGS